MDPQTLDIQIKQSGLKVSNSKVPSSLKREYVRNEIE